MSTTPAAAPAGEPHPLTGYQAPYGDWTVPHATYPMVCPTCGRPYGPVAPYPPYYPTVVYTSATTTPEVSRDGQALPASAQAERQEVI